MEFKNTKMEVNMKVIGEEIKGININLIIIYYL